MPAPDLTPQTPGEPLGTITPLAGAIADANKSDVPALPDFTAKHNGGGRWVVIDANAPQVDGKDVKVGDFAGSKEEALAEVVRLSDGGEPLVLGPQRTNEAKAPAQAQLTTADIDATALKQPVMTAEGWLCPEPKAKD